MSTTTIRTADRDYLVHLIPLHRRYHCHGRGVYARPSDWLATCNDKLAWGRTRRDAIKRFMELVGADNNVTALRA